VTGRGQVGGLIFCKTLHRWLWTEWREKAAGALAARGARTSRQRTSGRIRHPRQSSIRALSRALGLVPWLLVASNIIAFPPSASGGLPRGSLVEPEWTVDLRAAGYRTHPDRHEAVTDFSFPPLCFLENGKLVVSFVAHRSPANLQRRQDPGISSPTQLVIEVLDSVTGSRTGSLNLDLEHPFGGVACAPGSTFVAATLNRLQLYSSDLRLTSELMIPPASNPGWVPWSLRSSPSGRSLLLEYYEPIFSPSSAPSERQRYLATTDNDYQWIDAASLRPLQTWTQEPLQYFSISDSQIILIETWLELGRSYVELRTGDGTWRREPIWRGATLYH